MNETQINGLLAALETQRNNALNAAAQAEGVNAALREKITQLEGELQMHANANAVKPEQLEVPA